MTEPEVIELVEVFDKKGAPIKGVSFEKKRVLPAGKTSAPWFPVIVLAPTSLSAAWRGLFPRENAHEGTELRILDTPGMGQRHAIALYGPAPKLEDAPKPEPEPAPAPSALPAAH